MGLFELLGKPSGQRKREEAERRARREDLDLYPGMRMEVTGDGGRLFLAVELLELRGDRAKLRPVMDGSLLTRFDAPVPVTMRGYSSRRNGAVVVEASVHSGPNNTWRAEHLELVKRVDGRASFRMDVDLEAAVVPMGRPRAPEEPCRLRNISTGGACISMAARHNVGDKLLLRASLLPETEPAALVCQIVRIVEHRHDYFEYGCRFLNLEAADENCVLRSIFLAQK